MVLRFNRVLLYLDIGSHLWTDNVCDGPNHAVIVIKMFKNIN